MRPIAFAVASVMLIAAVTDKPRPIAEARLDMFELLAYRERDHMQALEKVREQQRALFGEVCRLDGGIEAADFKSLIDACAVDLQAKTVARKEPSAKK